MVQNVLINNNITNLFLYDNLWLNELKINPISWCLAEATGKLFTVQKQNVMLNMNDININRSNNRIIGVLYKLLPEDMLSILCKFDDIYDCSQSKFGIQSSFDTMYREIIQVRPIIYDTITNLGTWNYSYNKPKITWVYKGNIQNKTIIRFVKTNRHRIMSGVSQDVINFIKEVHK